jgi:hypothetical protein
MIGHTYKTRFENPFTRANSKIAEYYERLYKGEYLCSRESSQIRKDVHTMIKHGYPIEVIHCDCGSVDRLHNAYYYEFARSIPQ